ncbi:RagB/SusD family nutrient uptake outer membrane protein [Chitinophaga sp. 22321]|uniref:RagB/SusD family nutrient uptake outer membrane protein n=1 Tax=Chitinophaga hostae TaxID=2831022 RepID=A0ABS5IXS3_9BACT|nr:RagB/SusD family nutrient uptake outer membrane protein [Chitinophaga hostae]MBS0027772.1 RagB/SusD family nutrient uptake outer membrane protein [Chitinophaga hostae]
MKQSILILLTIISGSLASCSKFLDVKPKGKLIPTEVADFDHLLDNSNIAQWVFLDNNTGCNLGYLTDNLSLSDGLGNINYKANNHPNIDRYWAYLFRQPYKNPATSDYFWDWGTYRSMAYFNNVIDGVNGITNLTNENQQYAKRVVAQALVNRAWSYFITTMVYGPVYKPGSPNDTKTIPYVISSDVGATLPDLSTQEQAFALVSKDVHAALADIPEVTNWPSRPTKVAAQALLAYYHLFTQKYDSVVYYANLAWTAASAGGTDKLIYDYNGFSWTEPTNIINSTIKAQDNFLTAANSRENLFYRNIDAGAGRSTSSYPSDEVIALYDQANDLRFKYFFLTAPGYKTTYNNVTYDDGNRIQYYRGSKTTMTAGFTYPELLLMRAEGYARTNRLSAAIDDLNTLRRYRYKTGTPPLVVGSQAEVIQQVLDERRRELPLGSFKRFLDLKRLCLETGKPWSKQKVQHKIGTETYSGTIDSKDFILTISNVVLKFNPQWNIPLDGRPF